MSEVAIHAEGLTKWFGEGEARTVAVRNVQLDVLKGEVTYIIGPSGSGKTTLLSMMSGILRPNEGKVVLNGVDLWRLAEDRIADMRLNTIGFVFQDYHLFPRLTTAENVAVPLILRRQPWKSAIAEAKRCLEIVGLGNRVELRPNKLSGGEQQRVAIARAIASAPDILILDEPTASLDGDTGRKIIEFVRKDVLSAERCILIVTHDERIFSYADRIVKMADGAIVGVDKGEFRA